MIQELMSDNIINGDGDTKINAYKTIYSRMPSKLHYKGIFKDFYGLIYSLNYDRLKAIFHMNKLWDSILGEFRKMEWHYDKKKSVEYINKCKTIHELIPKLRSTLGSKENQAFFKVHPYVEDLLFITEMLQKDNKTSEEEANLSRVIGNYKIALHRHDSLLPALTFKEHINLMLRSKEFDQEFYTMHMKDGGTCIKGWISAADLLLMYVNNDSIPYSIRRGNEGFKKFDWDALDGLYKALYDESVKGRAIKEIQNMLGPTKSYLEQLILYEVGEIDIDAVQELKIDELAKINSKTKIEPAFEIIGYYLEIAKQIPTDNSDISKLAIARVITALGESIFAIKSLIPEEKIGLLEKLNDLRDHIVHSSTYQSFKYFEELIFDKSNTTLTDILPQLINLEGFFAKLKTWIAEEQPIDDFPNIPDLAVIEQFEKEYAANRSKDDREVKLSLGDTQNLETDIPEDDEVQNPLYENVRSFINDGQWISRENFVIACLGSKDLGVDSCRPIKRLKNLYDILKELDKIKRYEKAMEGDDFDFNIVKLNLKKSAALKLERIKQAKNIEALISFLAEHQANKTKLVNVNDFLESVERDNLTQHKTILRNFLEEKSVSPSSFKLAVEVVFKNNESAQDKWNSAYDKTQQKILSCRQDQATQVKFTIESIEKLKNLTDQLDTGEGIDIVSNPTLSLACEMQFGICSSTTKSVMRFIDKMFDYNDKSLYFIFFPHPIEEAKGILEAIVMHRNNLFHFEKTFGGEAKIFSQRSDTFSVIENLTQGMFFQEAIILSKAGAATGQCTRESRLLKLKKYFALIQKSLEESALDIINQYDLMNPPSDDSDSEDPLSEEDTPEPDQAGSELVANIENNFSIENQNEMVPLGDINGE